jgi:DNA (cytosine-5)-methyltransferase 3A
MNVLSLCDGISCGRIALERAGIKVDKYYASEINEPSIKVALDNYPDIIELGDIKNWKEWDIQWKDIDLLIGGTPC